jgi:hypothetical protein
MVKRILFLLLFLPGLAHAAFPEDAIPVADTLKLWWDGPQRAYTGLTTTWRMSYYEHRNKGLRWSIANAPTGMTIDQTGTITYVNPQGGPHANIVVTARREVCIGGGCALSVQQVFTTTVGTSDFVFVDDTGTDNAGCGAIGSPCAKLSYALANKITGTDGKTVYMREGNYTDSWSTGSSGVLGAAFTAADPAIIANYPGEAVSIDASAAAGLTTHADSRYVIVQGIRIHSSTGEDRGNFYIRGSHIIVKDVISDSADFDDNLTGIVLFSHSDGHGDDVVLNRAVVHSNANGTGTAGNQANVLTYNDMADSVRWVLNTKAYGSNINFKIKHTNADNSRTIFHNLESHTSSADWYGFAGFGKNSSLRYSVFYNDAGTCIFLGRTDPSAYTVQGMLIENNTCTMVATALGCIITDAGYGTTGPITLNRNICHQVNGAPQELRADFASSRKMFAGWIDTNGLATVAAYPFAADYNLYYNPDSSPLTFGFQAGNNGAPVYYNLAGWKAIGSGRDANSSNADPGFADAANGDLNITASDNAATLCGSGEYCGAFRPDTVYGTVGAANNTLLSFDGPTPDPIATDDGPVAALINYICRRHRR